MAAKGIVDVYVNADRVAFALPNIPLDRVPIGWRFSKGWSSMRFRPDCKAPN